MNATPSHQALQPEFRLFVLLVSIGFFMQGLDTTIVNTAIPAMAANLGEDPLQMHSVVVAYVLVGSCLYSLKRMAGRPFWCAQYLLHGHYYFYSWHRWAADCPAV